MLIEGLTYEWSKDRKHIRFIVTEKFDQHRGEFTCGDFEGFQIGSSSYPEIEMGIGGCVYVWLPGVDTLLVGAWVSYVEGLEEALAFVGVFPKRKVKVSLYGRSSV